MADVHFPGFLHDDTGDNISRKNRSYCELTAQYWAWKNIDIDYYGFFHYRRYLYPDERAKRPYRIEDRPSLSLLDKLGYGRFEELITQYDIILPRAENMYISVRDHYAGAPFHHIEDLNLIERIIQQRYPKMKGAIEQYLSGTICYFGNIFIMSKPVFFAYCTWLFSILEEFDYQKKTPATHIQEQRVDGYLAERLLGIYYTMMRERFQTLELPRVHFHQGSTGIKKRLLNVLLPPGSRRRAEIKRWKGSIQ